jgi:hypothetical protein
MGKNFFTENVLGDWDGTLSCKTIKGEPDLRQLTKPLPCGDSEIPIGFIWNGASVGIMRYAGFLAFPKWKHPIATCRHDWRCGLTKNKEERAFADSEFRRDVNRTGTRFEKVKGFFGVRVGAFFKHTEVTQNAGISR